VSSSPPPFLKEKPATSELAPANALGFTCATNMAPPGREVQAERPGTLRAYRVRCKPLLGLTPRTPRVRGPRAVQTREHLYAVAIDSVIHEVWKAPEDRPTIPRRDLRERLRKLSDHVDGVFKRPKEVATEASALFLVPLPGQFYV
jgi:hypothetical protein